MSPERKRITKPLAKEEFQSLINKLEGLSQNLTQEEILKVFGDLVSIHHRLSPEQKEEIQKIVEKVSSQLGIEIPNETADSKI